MTIPSGSDTAEKVFSVVREPTTVDGARRFAELATAGCDADCVEASIMAAVELTENIVKYSAPIAGGVAGTIAFLVSGVRIRVRATTDTVASTADAEYVLETITRLASSPDAKKLYEARLRELFDEAGLARAQLGVLRIAFEGRFRLSCTFRPPKLEIIAERVCEHAPH